MLRANGSTVSYGSQAKAWLALPGGGDTRRRAGAITKVGHDPTKGSGRERGNMEHRKIQDRTKGNDGWVIRCSCGRTFAGWRFLCEERYADHLPMVDCFQCYHAGRKCYPTNSERYAPCPEYMKGTPDTTNHEHYQDDQRKGSKLRSATTPRRVGPGKGK